MTSCYIALYICNQGVSMMSSKTLHVIKDFTRHQRLHTSCGILWNMVESLICNTISIIYAKCFYSHFSLSLSPFISTSISTLPSSSTTERIMAAPLTPSLIPPLIPYLSSPALRAAKLRIENPPNAKSYEHHVGTWMGTLLKNVFQEDKWTITPEQRDIYSKNIPDFSIEKLSDNTLKPHLFVEIKKRGGQSLAEALLQLIGSIDETLEEQGNSTGDQYQAYVIVQRGLDIGFFEYYNLDALEMSERGLDETHHFQSCISLTQPILLHEEDYIGVQDRNQPAPWKYPTPGLKRLADPSLGRLEDLDVCTQNEARNYNVPCIFNINYHENEINNLMSWIMETDPRR